MIPGSSSWMGLCPKKTLNTKETSLPFTSCELQNGCNLTILPPGHPSLGFQVSATTYPEEGARVGGSRGLRRESSISLYSMVVPTGVDTWALEVTAVLPEASLQLHQIASRCGGSFCQHCRLLWSDCRFHQSCFIVPFVIL